MTGMVATNELVHPVRLFSLGEARVPTSGVAHDAYGRAMTYLRISLTDRCNFRCVYCMPALGMKFLPRPEMLTSDELLLVVRAAAAAGFRKIRLTGGEPTLRPDLVELVRAIKATPGI